MGAGMGCAFAATHPEMVDHLVACDMISPILRPPEKTVGRTRAGIDNIFQTEKKLATGKEPVHSYEEAKAKLIRSESGTNKS